MVAVDGASATDTEVSPGETYAYSVFAQAAGSSAWVGQVSTIVRPPHPPTSRARRRPS